PPQPVEGVVEHLLRLLAAAEHARGEGQDHPAVPLVQEAQGSLVATGQRPGELNVARGGLGQGRLSHLPLLRAAQACGCLPESVQEVCHAGGAGYRPGMAPTGQLPGFERYLAVRQLGAPALSPRGDVFAYIANTTGLPGLWLQPVGGGFPRQLTALADQRV